MSQDTLMDKLISDMKAAMKSGNKTDLGVIRQIIARIKRVALDEQCAVDDALVLQVLQKMVKEYHDAIAQFTQAKRQDLVDKEQAEVTVVARYLPAPLSAAEMDSLVKEAIAQCGATTMRDMGRVMALLKEKLPGSAQMTELSKLLKTLLQ